MSAAALGGARVTRHCPLSSAQEDGGFVSAGKGTVGKYCKLDSFFVEQDGPSVSQPTSSTVIAVGDSAGYWVLAESGWAFGIYADTAVACRS